MRKWLLGLLFLGLTINAYADWNSTDPQTLTASGGFTQVAACLQALDGTSGSPPANITFGSGLLLNGTNTTRIDFTTPTANRTITFPDATGTVALSGATQNVTFQSVNITVATGTAPFTINSTTKSTNLNADLLDGYTTSLNQTASTVPVLDANGTIGPFIKSYDSGWFAVSANSNYAKTHSLGTTKILISFYYSSDGSSDMRTAMYYVDVNGVGNGMVINAITTTTLNLATGGTVYYVNAGGGAHYPSSGYARVIATALE